MRTKLNLLAAGIFLAALGTGFGQPTITQQPQPCTNAVGTTATFWVVATGTEPLACQWQKLSGSWADLAGCTVTNLVLTNVQTSHAGDYRVVITNVDGTVTSDVARLSVIVPATLQFSTNYYYAAENAGSVILTVLRTGDTNAVVLVDYASANSSAIAGLDYTDANGTLIFAAGETKKTITVPILNDGLVESPIRAEVFMVILSNPTNANLGAWKSATVAIVENDGGLILEFAKYWAREEEGTVWIGVVRGDDGNFPIGVDFATSDLTATNGLDYTATNGTLSFAAGEKVKLFTVPILSDGLKESSETFRVTLSNPTNQVLGSQQTATITILDNDPGVQFEFSQYRVQENEVALTVKVLRGNDVDLPLFTVDFATTNLTALAGQDYTETSGTLTFAAGETAKTITIPITYDEQQEADETCKLTLSNPSEGIVLGFKVTATITLLDTTGTAAHRFDRIAVLPDQSVQLTFGGGVSKRFKDYFDLYPIEVSTNLVDWTPLTTLQRTNSNTNAFTFTDTQAGTASMRFYRTVTNQLIAPFRKPTGPFAVGVTSRLLTDPTRRNRYGISTNGSFMVSVWYPAVQEPGRLPGLFIERQYAQDPATQGTFTDRMPYFVGHAPANAQCATNQAPYPIVVYSPGWTGPRSGATEHAENLASHGYVVAAVDHFDAEGTAFPDGSYLRGDMSDAGHTVAGCQDRANDLRFVLDELVRWNDADPTFRERLDTTKVAAMGFSWGGSTVAEFLWSDERVKAVVFVDGSPDLWPGYGGAAVLQFGLSKPFLSIYSTEFAETTDLYNKATKDAVWFRISSTMHGNLSGWYWWSYPNDLATGREATRTVNAFTVWFLNKYLKGSADPTPSLRNYPRIINFKQK